MWENVHKYKKSISIPVGQEANSPFSKDLFKYLTIALKRPLIKQITTTFPDTRPAFFHFLTDSSGMLRKLPSKGLNIICPSSLLSTVTLPLESISLTRLHGVKRES